MLDVAALEALLATSFTIGIDCGRGKAGKQVVLLVHERNCNLHVSGVDLRQACRRPR